MHSDHETGQERMPDSAGREDGGSTPEAADVLRERREEKSPERNADAPAPGTAGGQDVALRSAADAPADATGEPRKQAAAAPQGRMAAPAAKEGASAPAGTASPAESKSAAPSGGGAGMPRTDRGEPRLEPKPGSKPAPEPKRKSAWPKLAAAVAVVLLLAVAGYSCRGRGGSALVVPPPEQRFGFNYGAQVEGWNRHAGRHPARYRFIGGAATPNADVRRTLEAWCGVFAVPADPGMERQLEDFGRRTRSAFHEYEDFRRKHRRSTPIRLDENMDGPALATALNAYLGVETRGGTPNYVMRESVDVIVHMNSFCAWFEANRDDLRNRGIDSSIVRCGDLGTGGRYPKLDALIDAR